MTLATRRGSRSALGLVAAALVLAFAPRAHAQSVASEAPSTPPSPAPDATSSSPPPSSDDDDASTDATPSTDHHRVRTHRAPPAPGYGRIRVAVNRPETEVFVDGRDVGVAPYEGDVLRGMHEIRLETPGFKTWHGGIEVREGMLTPLRAALRPQVDRGTGFMTLGIATFVLGVGIGTGIGSNLDHAALERDRQAGTLDNRDPRIDRGAILAGAADASFVLAAVVGALGIYMVAHESGQPSIAQPGPFVGLTPHARTPR